MLEAENTSTITRSHQSSSLLIPFLYLAVFVLALGVRLAYWSDARGYTVGGDEPDYVVPAQTLLREGRYVDTFISRARPWTRVPLTSLFFAGSFLFVPDKAAAGAEGDDAALMEPRYDALNFAQIVASLVTVGFIMLLAARCFPQRARLVALIAGFISALYPPLASSPAQRALSEPLSIMLIVAALYALSHWSPAAPLGRSFGVLVITGALLGAATLTRSVALGFVPFALLWFVIVYRAWMRSERAGDLSKGTMSGNATSRLIRKPFTWLRLYLRPLLSGGIVTLVCLLVIAPWTYYNYLQYRSFLLLETANATAYWNYHNYRGEDYFIRLNELPDPAERLSLTMREGTANIIEYPDKALRTSVEAFFYFWHLESNSAVLLNPWDMTQRDPDVPDLLHSDAMFLLVGLAGVAGLAGVGLRRPTTVAGRTLLVLNLWLLLMVLLGIIVPYDGRYRLPAVPSFIVYASGLLVLADWRVLLSFRRMLATIRRNPQVATLTVVLSLWVLGGAYTPDIPPLLRSLYHSWRGDLALFAGEASIAFGRYDLAQKAFPSFYWPYRHAADIARESGRDDEARSLYEESRRRNPHDPYSMLGFADLAAKHPEWALTAGEATWLNMDETEWRGNPWNSLRPSPSTSIDVGTDRDIGYQLGFFKSERPPDNFDYRWSRGRSTIRIPIPAGSSGSEYRSVILRMSAPALGTEPFMQVSVSVAGSAPQTFEVPVGWADYKVGLPQVSGRGGELLVLRIESPTRNPQADSREKRSLGVGLDRVTLSGDVP